MEDTKTSLDWMKLVPSEYQLKILDPDGWDRTNYDYSYNKELITKAEFKKRVINSTISASLVTKFITQW